MLDFSTALEQGRQVLEMFPNGELYRSNFALYAMYAGAFDDAAATARTMIDQDPSYGTAFLPLAIASLAKDDFDGARAAYEGMRMATRSPHMDSLGILGLADMAIYAGQFDAAIALLEAGIETDKAAAANHLAALKNIALGESYVYIGDFDAALAATREALELSLRDTIQVSAAMIYIQAGRPDLALPIREWLATQINDHDRAYGLMIEGILQRLDGDFINAIQTLRFALNTTDLWRINLELGRTYL